MKKVFLFVSAAIAALAMVSCNKEIEIQDKPDMGCPDGYYVEELVAEYPHDPETRTAFNETTGKFAWTEGDELAFHLSNGTYTSAPIDPATSKVKLYLPVGVTRNNYAVYPASAVVAEAAEVGNMQVTLPSTYDISDNLTTEFVPMPLIATNDADNKKLKFEHVGALLQVNLNVPAGVKTAKLSMGKTITGTFDLADGSGNGVIEAGATSDDALTFVLSEEGLASETEVKLLAPLPSGTYEKFEVVYDNGFAFTKNLSSSPWNFDRTQGKKVSIAEENFEDPNDYFWFEALEAGSTVQLRTTGSSSSSNPSDVPIEFSVDNKISWNQWDWSEGTVTLEDIGDRVYFRGSTGVFSNMGFNHGYAYPQSFNHFEGTGQLKVGGLLSTLLGRDGASMATPYCFTALFMNNLALIDASELVLCEELTVGCYEHMFYYCENLVSAPQFVTTSSIAPERCYYWMFSYCYKMETGPDILPSMSVGQNAYNGMFYKCYKLLSAPELPATELGGGCYRDMFYLCSKIPSFQETLPALSVPDAAYFDMFYGCSSLTVAPVLPAMDIASACYAYMFSGSGILDVPELPATELYATCYRGMFDDCDALTEIDMVLPATHVPSNAYAEMFRYCGNLVNAPEIDAETMESSGMAAMFAACPNLVYGPSRLKPLVVPANGYDKMFAGDALLERAPVIEATDISASACLRYMFCGCNSLSELEVHFSDWGTEGNSTQYWVSNATYNTTSSSRHRKSGVASSGKFYKPEGLEIKENYEYNSGCQHYIPLNWTVYNLEEVGAGM